MKRSTKRISWEIVGIILAYDLLALIIGQIVYEYFQQESIRIFFLLSILGCGLVLSLLGIGAIRTGGASHE